MNNIAKTFICYGACLLAFTVGKKFYDEYQESRAISQRDSAIADAVSKLNIGTPKMIDEVTRLDGVSYMPGVAINAKYTIPSMQRKDINVLEFSSGAKQAATAQLCNSPSAKAAMGLGITYGYFYRDSDGSLISDFRISKADCI